MQNNPQRRQPSFSLWVEGSQRRLFLIFFLNAMKACEGKGSETTYFLSP